MTRDGGRRVGTVYLVGAGPGDPGLLTVRGARLLRRADVVAYDALVHPRLLDLVRPDAVRLDVGKRSGGRGATQAAIETKLIDAARWARTVVRLKGGDPFVFGRGGEEALALRAAGVPYRVVPGVTAGVAVPAYAGIPVTHRGIAGSATFVNGHGAGEEDFERWVPLVRAGGTLVAFMPMKTLGRLAEGLIRAGLAADTPAAAIAWGTYGRQRVVAMPLSRLPGGVAAEGLGTPATVVVGAAVALAGSLAWFPTGPLAGARILVPRARPQRSRLIARLERLGAHVDAAPVVRSAPAVGGSWIPEGPGPTAGAGVALGAGWDVVVVTSRTGVDALVDGLGARRLDLRALAGVRIVAVGAATAEAFGRRGIRADLALRTHRAGALVEALGGAAACRGRRVLYLGGGIGPFEGADALEDAGAVVERARAFEPVVVAEGLDETRRALDDGSIGWVLFASSSTVHTFCRAFESDVGRARVAAVGPSTARTARAHGLPVHVVAADPTPDGLVEALLERTAVRAVATC